MQVFAMMTGKGKSYGEALRQVLKAILVSPQFLFITPDADADASHDIVPLDDHQLASRLSYLLWATMPDAELGALADAGKLHEPAVLARRPRRMLADARSRALFDGFGAQWLGLDKLDGKAFDTAKFPAMTSGPAHGDVRRGAAALRQHHARGPQHRRLHRLRLHLPQRPPCHASTASTKTVTGPEMRKVQLTDANRGGILAMPGILAVTSLPQPHQPGQARACGCSSRSSGSTSPPPPPNVPALEKQDPKKVAASPCASAPSCTATTRPAPAATRSSIPSASAWRISTPSDAGATRTTPAGRSMPPASCRATSASPRPRSSRSIIAGRKDDFCQTLTGKLLAYALCRQLEGYDEIVIDEIAEAVAKDGYHMQTLVTAVVTSYPFLNRRHATNHGPPHAQMTGSSTAAPASRASAPPSPCPCSRPWAGPIRPGRGLTSRRCGSASCTCRTASSWSSSGRPIAATFLDRAAAAASNRSSRDRPVPGGQGHQRRADRAVQRRAARARTLHLAHRHAARCEQARHRSTSRISADQIAANYVGGFTALPSLELATMPQTHKENQEGLNEGYYSHCSFRSPTQPLPAEINPRSGVEASVPEQATRPAASRARRTDGRCPSTAACWTWSSAAPRTCAAAQPRRPAQARRIPRQRALASNAASPPSSSGRTRRPRPPRASAGPTHGANDSPPIESRSPRATSAASTCRSCATSTCSPSRPTSRA